ncbi:SGNH/GDSL hydrolase family protein [Bradyrhizobium sp. BWA-3-5]|uniref:SGNH/GDSL hydrolase family protein n=1 Tax=Bradyrhizobium sp. BWA-3-5 TaxID=3080013 RepID=UPI00293E9F85|nr:SGNH/GDSL hydrolase family protein [Bradyrhizobium sp. BWA-3-5]WOH63222.1 SGNH/GDSL hydrolase family protein [Bradyrhizobium sp. BWA-3-5]
MIDNFALADLPDEVIGFKYPLRRLAAALRKEPVRIVAMGSSSTAGREDVVPYPHWMEMYLRRDTGNARIDVLNRGKGGEEADRELPRFNTDIFAEAPSLVIWQVGTNAVFRDKEFDFDTVVAAIESGLDRLRGHSEDMDVMLIDPQYVPAMLLDDKADLSERMVARISAAAERVKVNVFHRWALMRHWHVHNNIALDRMIDPTDPDRLHQSDGSTLRLSRGLSNTIRRAVATAEIT